MPEYFALLLLVFGILLLVLICAAFGYTILQPMARAIRGKKLPIKFYVSDFFSLSFLIAIPLVFVTHVRQLHGGDTSIANFFSFILVGMGAYVWWRGTAFLSGIGVLHAGRRCLFLGILMPIAILGSAFGIPILYAMLFSTANMTETEVALWLIGVIAAPTIAWCGRLATLWVVSDPSIPTNAAPLEGHTP